MMKFLDKKTVKRGDLIICTKDDDYYNPADDGASGWKYIKKGTVGVFLEFLPNHNNLMDVLVEGKVARAGYHSLEARAT